MEKVSTTASGQMVNRKQTKEPLFAFRFEDELSNKPKTRANTFKNGFFLLLSSFSSSSFFFFLLSLLLLLLFFDYRYVIGFQFNEVCFYMNKTSKDSVIDVMKITMFDISYVFEHHTKELDSTYLSHNIIAMFSQGDLMVLLKKKKRTKS